MKEGSEGSGLIYILRPGEWDGMGRWEQCWRGRWKIGLGQMVDGAGKVQAWFPEDTCEKQ